VNSPDPAQNSADSVSKSGSAPDPAFLRRVRDREPAALGEFFDRYLPLVYSIVMRLTGQAATAEDLTQEVFLKVHRALDRLDPERDPAPWLTTISYNACRDLWRSAAGRLQRESSSIDEHEGIAVQLAHTGPTPLASLEREEREELVRRAIQALPQQQKEVVVLHDYEGMSHEEIAGLVGATPVAVRKRYSRALAALATMLKDDLS